MCFVVVGGSFTSLTMEGSQASAWEVTSCSLPLQVHIPNQCHAGGTRLAPGESLGQAELSESTKTRDLEQLKKDPNSCFFEGQHRAHGTRWAPDYDKKCSICSCQVRAGGCAEGAAPIRNAPV